MFREPIDEPEYTTPILPPEDQSAIIASLISEIQASDDDFHALKEMFNKMRADRDRWRKIADSMVTCLNHSIAATDAWEAYEDALLDDQQAANDD